MIVSFGIDLSLVNILFFLYFKVNAEAALGQVEVIMDSISMRLVSSERQVIEMDELSISLSKVTSEKLDGMSVEEGPTQFRLPTNISQGAVGDIAAKVITKLVTLAHC